MTKIFYQIKSKTDKKYYSTYIEIDEKGEIIDYGCTCTYGSFYMWSKRNGEGTKPCWHINHLKEKYENARNKIKKIKPDTKSDNVSVGPANN